MSFRRVEEFGGFGLSRSQFGLWGCSLGFAVWGFKVLGINGARPSFYALLDPKHLPLGAIGPGMFFTLNPKR